MAKIQVVFGRGLLSARPAAAKEGYHYFATDQGILYRDSGSAWEAVSSRGLAFAFSTTTADADPGAGIIRFDNATPASVTTVRIDDQCHSSDADLSTYWAAVSGARLLITQADDVTKYILGLVTAVADGTGYYNLTVTIEDSGTLPDDGALLNVHVLGGGGGGGSANWWDQPTAHILYHTRLANTVRADDDGTAMALLTGTSQVRGLLGAGGFSETEVLCSCLNDVSPATSGRRGIYGSTLQYSRADMGVYCRSVARFPVQDDQDLFTGLQVSMTDPTAATVVCAGFSIRGNATDANWQCQSGSGSSLERTDSGVAWATGDWHVFETYVYDNGGTMTVKFWIDGALIATHTTQVPGATDDLQPIVASFFHAAGDTGSYDQVIFCYEGFMAVQDSEVIINLGFATL